MLARILCKASGRVALVKYQVATARWERWGKSDAGVVQASNPRTTASISCSVLKCRFIGKGEPAVRSQEPEFRSQKPGARGQKTKYANPRNWIRNSGA